MARYKRYIDTDVVAEALKRIHHVFDLFDTVAVCFSGGKDSLTCLHLTWQVARQRGLDHVRVIFRDEELIPSSVLDFVNGYRLEPWVRMRWFCLPLRGDQFVLGRRTTYVQWDRDRAWIREMPPWAIRQPEGAYRVLDQYTADEACAAGWPGSVAFITGIRADESLVRYRSVVNKLSENYITTPVGSTTARIKTAKPIYDWTENDVFKWLGEHGVAWCPLYNAQHLAGVGLRVSTPLHAEAAKRIDRLRALDPEFYDRLLAVFPDMALQDRYWRDFDGRGVKARYADGWEGCRRYIAERITDPGQRRAALKRYRETLKLAQRSPGSYTPVGLLDALVSGSVKRTLLPTRGPGGAR
ncbi:MAG: phosphoadenosine phosphosulfate reductase family protein [Pirellulales bacterium]|nr:phosphoadenosine phosphosulfate reductase family protein [Pirellulales bacterium]